MPAYEKPTATDDPARLRSRAQRVERSLAALLRRFEALDPLHPHASQRCFAALYLGTTRAWLRRLPQLPDPSFAYCVMPTFFALYRTRVIEALDAPLNHVAPHWRAYHRQARRMARDATPLAQLWLVTLGVRAHVQGDLGEAILQVERQTGRALSAEGPAMFGPLGARAFVEAARGCTSGQALGAMATALHPLWLPVLQHWRAEAHRQARALLSPLHAPG